MIEGPAASDAPDRATRVTVLIGFAARTYEVVKVDTSVLAAFLRSIW